MMACAEQRSVQEMLFESAIEVVGGAKVALGLVVEACNRSYVGVCAESERKCNCDADECQPRPSHGRGEVVVLDIGIGSLACHFVYA